MMARRSAAARNLGREHEPVMDGLRLQGEDLAE